jgi:streptogramin lyase
MRRYARWRLAVGVVAAALPGTLLPAAAQAASITEFSSGVTAPSAITDGPDGNMWFTDTHAIGRITTSGAVTEFSAGLNPGAHPFGNIVVGSDGNLWFSDIGSPQAIGRITPSGTITEFDLGAGESPDQLVLGPDGNVWFLQVGSPKSIDRITPSGTITEFSTGLNANTQPNALTVGPDGNLWFTDQGSTPAIGRVTPAGVIAEFEGPLMPLANFPNDITAGPDGNVWFTDSFGSVGKVTPSGTITLFNTGLEMGAAPDEITEGTDGNLWVVDQNASHRAIVRVTPSGTITEFTSGLSTAPVDDITTGPDGNLWAEQSMPGSVARVTPSGSITEFTAGLNPGAGADGDQLITGPDGNLWFNDGGTTKAIGRALVLVLPRVTAGAASAITSSGATVSASVTPIGMTTAVSFQYGTKPTLGSTVKIGSLPASVNASAVKAKLSGLPAGSVIYYRAVAGNSDGTTNGAIKSFKTHGSSGTSVTIGNQQVTVALSPTGTCVAKGKTLSVSLKSKTLKHGTKLKFVGASVFVDKGVKHKHGKKVVFKANKVVHKLPATVKLKLAGLKSGSHTIKLKLTYKTVVKHGHSKSVKKTVSVKFKVC